MAHVGTKHESESDCSIRAPRDSFSVAASCHALWVSGLLHWSWILVLLPFPPLPNVLSSTPWATGSSTCHTQVLLEMEAPRPRVPIIPWFMRAAPHNTVTEMQGQASLLFTYSELTPLTQGALQDSTMCWPARLGERPALVHCWSEPAFILLILLGSPAGGTRRPDQVVLLYCHVAL
jgi:hypothetical protein